MSHTCPRRSEGPGYADKGEDDYKSGRCSYCGSLDPDVFMARLEAGDVKLEPTDKDYKVYVLNKGGVAFERGMDKFYFQHLSLEQRKRFVELFNAKRITLDEPGYFYRLPYFMVRTDK